MSSMRLSANTEKAQASLIDLASGNGRDLRATPPYSPKQGFESNLQQAVQKKNHPKHDFKAADLPVTPAKDHHALSRAPESSPASNSKPESHSFKLPRKENESTPRADLEAKPAIAKANRPKQARRQEHSVKEDVEEDVSRQAQDLNSNPNPKTTTKNSPKAEDTSDKNPDSDKNQTPATDTIQSSASDNIPTEEQTPQGNQNIPEDESDEIITVEEYLAPPLVLSDIPASEWAGTLAEAFLEAPLNTEPEMEVAIEVGESLEPWAKKSEGMTPSPDQGEALPRIFVEGKTKENEIDVEGLTQTEDPESSVNPPLLADANLLEKPVKSGGEKVPTGGEDLIQNPSTVEQKPISDKTPIPISEKRDTSPTAKSESPIQDPRLPIEPKVMPLSNKVMTQVTETQEKVDVNLPSGPPLHPEALRLFHAKIATQENTEEDVSEATALNPEVEKEGPSLSSLSPSLASSTSGNGQGNSSSDQQPPQGQNENPLQALNASQGRWNPSQQNNGATSFVTEAPLTVPKDSLSTTASLHDLQNFLRREIDSKAATLWRQGQDEIHLQLMPEHLGKVHVSLEMREGSVNAKIHVQSEAAKQAVDQGLQQLRDSLGQHGFKIENLSVTVEDRHAGLFNPDGKDSQQFFRHRQEGGANAASQEEELTHPQETAAIRWMGYNTLEIVA